MILTIYAKEYLRKLILLGSHQTSSDEVFGQWKPVVDVVLNVRVDMSNINLFLIIVIRNARIPCI